MRLIIFTLDSVFALIIAAAGISMLAYFFYTPQTTTILTYSSAESILQNLLSTSTGAVAQSNPLYSNLTYQANASNEVSDQYRNDIYSSGSNIHGPLSPSVSFIFNAAAQPTNLTVDYGKVFFGAGSTLYAINATNGNLVWKKATGSTIYGDLAIAPGMLIYPNATNLTAVNPATNAFIWSSSGLASMGYLTPYSSPLVIYNNKIYFGGKAGGSAADLAYYLNNGTNAWKYTVPSGGYSSAIVSGDIAIEHAGNLFNLMEDFGTSANAIWSIYVAPTLGFSIVPGSSIIALSGSTQANAMYINRTVVPGFPYGYISTSTQPAVYQNVIYYQSSNAVTAVASNGVQLWSSSLPAAVGVSSSWDIVLASAKTVYTEWSNNYVAAINSSTGNVAWYSQVPTQIGTLMPGGMALAYGRLYVVAGNSIVSYGSCPASSGAILNIAASLYANGQGSCADALVNGVLPMSNYSIFLNGTFAPALSLANFNGRGSSIQNPTKAAVNSLQTFTISAWIYPTNTANSPYIYTEGSPAMSMGFGITSANALTISTTKSGSPLTFTSSMSIPQNRWSFVTAELSVGGATGTFLLSLNGQTQSGTGQPESGETAKYSGIGYNVGNSIGQSGGFFSGNIANLQIYNSSLTQAQMLQIFQGGLQGGPLFSAGLQAWYPLAGDSNDYSGYGNTAYALGVSYLPSNYLPAGYTNSYQVSSAGTSISIQNYTTGLSKLYKVGVVEWR
ncbi:MAG: PQQ-binding-like beta-propeller repeat protein [Candidatus Micrarchaeota archaeon]|nr:PQQ-binding-like beta-propeller repeat protein [Candidatus Micrarchaeota archaeon]